jgi:pentatricopeptide repeat protein
MTDEKKIEIVSWRSMVSGYVGNGEHEYAFLTFRSALENRLWWIDFL